MIALSGPGVERDPAIGCRDVLGRGMRPVEVIGPALEEEARRVFDG